MHLFVRVFKSVIIKFYFYVTFIIICARTPMLTPENEAVWSKTTKDQMTAFVFPDGTVRTAWDEGAGTRHQGAALVSRRRA